MIIPKCTYEMSKHVQTNEEINEIMQASSDEEVFSEIDDHVSENELSCDDEEDGEFQQPPSPTSTLLS